MKHEVIAIANQKGGVGKSTTAVNLGVGLAMQGKRVLIIDSDSQGNATQMLGWEQPDEIECTLATRMMNYINETPLPYDEGILHNEEKVDLIPANIELSMMETTLINTMSREKVLDGLIQELRPHYDYILIDCMPSLGMLTINALSAADKVIIPVQAQYLSAKGLEQLLKTIMRVKKQINPNLTVAGILITMMSKTNLSKSISELLHSTYKNQVNIFETQIPYTVKAAEVSATGKSIFAYEPSSKIAAAYRALAEEVI